jgi:hypothetical protein
VMANIGVFPTEEQLPIGATIKPGGASGPLVPINALNRTAPDTRFPMVRRSRSARYL